MATRTGKTAVPARTARHVGGDSDTLVVFGSPQRDVREIAGGVLAGRDMIMLNFFSAAEYAYGETGGGHDRGAVHIKHACAYCIMNKKFLLLCMVMGAAGVAIGGASIIWYIVGGT